MKKKATTKVEAKASKKTAAPKGKLTEEMKRLIAAGKNLNEEMGLNGDDKIDLEGTKEELTAGIENAASLIEDADDFSDETWAVLKELGLVADEEVEDEEEEAPAAPAKKGAKAKEKPAADDEDEEESDEDGEEEEEDEEESDEETDEDETEEEEEEEEEEEKPMKKKAKKEEPEAKKAAAPAKKGTATKPEALKAKEQAAKAPAKKAPAAAKKEGGPTQTEYMKQLFAKGMKEALVAKKVAEKFGKDEKWGVYRVAGHLKSYTKAGAKIA